MMFSPKLCDEQTDQGKVEGILAQLIVQLFDKTFNWQNSLVRSILTVFFQNFVLFSSSRCLMMLNALTKVCYSIIRSKYQPLAKGKKKAKVARKKTKNDSSESEFELDPSGNLSDDSEMPAAKVPFENIFKSLELALPSVVQVVLALVNKQFVKENGVFKLDLEMSSQFLIRLILLNQEEFKKVQIFKDVIIPIVEAIRVEQSDSLEQLR